ncbi:uncharacterized protein BJX67DRAFT_343729 [Aspergillus lucknowensis]|uniref:Uncharacterized protein n=1 Tax=Aspergillus lucknowensis TaxID=176173 RepID=A0ABR4M3H8_9EURO
MTRSIKEMLLVFFSPLPDLISEVRCSDDRFATPAWSAVRIAWLLIFFPTLCTTSTVLDGVPPSRLFAANVATATNQLLTRQYTTWIIICIPLRLMDSPVQCVENTVLIIAVFPGILYGNWTGYIQEHVGYGLV